MQKTSTKQWIALLAGLALAGPVAADGEITSHQKISYLEGGLGPVLSDDDRFGQAIERIGDLDGDGVPDLAVGAEGYTGASDGAVWILFMNSDGTVRDREVITASDVTPQAMSFVRFGKCLARLGDVDGDGTTDIAAGSSRYVWILYLNPDGTLKDDRAIDTANLSLDPEAMCGMTDLDGNGVPDLAIGDPYHAGGGIFRGAVEILFLFPNGALKKSQLISDQDGGFLGVLDDWDDFGSSLARVGDIDGDGVVDLAVGAPGDDDGDSSAGAVWILFMNPDGTVASEQKLSALFGGLTDPPQGYEDFGTALTRIGQFDGTEGPDLAVSSMENNGTFWLLFLEDDGTVRSMARYDQDTPGFPADGFGGFQGVSLGAVGDLDANGTLEIILGDPRDDDGGSRRGAIEIVFLEGVTEGSTKPYGCGNHLAQSLSVQSPPILGTTMQLDLHNPMGSQTAGTTIPVLAVALGAAAPCSVMIPDWHMDPLEPVAELAVLPPYAMDLQLGTPWNGAPVTMELPIPQDPSLLGLTIYVQGAMYDTSPTATKPLTLTRAIEVTIGS